MAGSGVFSGNDKAVAVLRSGATGRDRILRRMASTGPARRNVSLDNTPSTAWNEIPRHLP